MQWQPKISVITVVYNGAAVIEKTILSVINQTYANIEYIIIDGASADGTQDVINRYLNKIQFYISEPDSGIYHAMNKALNLASGDYVWFMNAGDTIFSNETLSSVIAETKDADIYYGDTEEVDLNGNKVRMRRMKYPEKLSFNSFKMGMVVSHQSVIIKKEIAGFYNLKYRISSDIDWVINSLKKSNNIINTKVVLCKYLVGGKARQNFLKGNIERFLIMINHYGFFTTILNHFIFLLRFFRFYVLAKLFPSLERN